MNKINMVFIPGWTMPATVLTALSQRFTGANCYLLDLPGIGQKKDQVVEPSFEAYAKVLLEEAPEKAIWIGWSLGGLIATHIALMHPSRVEAMISLSSTPRFIPDEKNHWPGIGLESLKQFSENLTNDFKSTLKQFIQLQFYGLKDKRTFKQLKLLQSFPWADIISSPTAVLNGLELIQKADFREDLKHIQKPLLYIFGRLDILAPNKVASLLPLYAPQCEIKNISDAAHAPFLSHEQECYELIHEFIWKYCNVKV